MKHSSILTVRDLNPQKKLGGVGNFYKCLMPYLTNTSYHYIGKRHEDKTNVFIRLFKDYKTLWFNLKTKDLLIINPSLNKNCIYRDGVSAILARIRKKKLIVFFRGWDPKVEQQVEKSWLLKAWINKTFLKADHIIVLSTKFKEKLTQWGYINEISLETTLVDETLLNGFDIKKKSFNTINILFLSTITRGKGILEALDGFHLLQKEKPELTFQVAGDGDAMPDVKEKIGHYHMIGVNLLGYVKDKQKADVFKNGGIFLFPSYHEGMPNAVLEAMAFGLPVITTRVGGLPDFFEDGKMGLFLDNYKPEHIAEKINFLLERPELMKQMSEYNYHYAKERFYASKVAGRLEKIITKVINE